jgi:methyl-accepting chemotaxis protein
MDKTSSSFLGSIRGRLIAGSSALALIPLILLTTALAYYAISQAKESLGERTDAQLSSIREGKRAEIGGYFSALSNAVRTLAQSDQVKLALKTGATTQPQLETSMGVDLNTARERLKAYYSDQFSAQYAKRNNNQTPKIDGVVDNLSARAVAAQYVYIANNANPLGQKNDLNAATDGSAYSQMHAQFHPFVRQLIENYKIYDFFLVDNDGNIVYTYFKELDYGTNLRNGPWAKTALADAYNSALASKNAGKTYLADYTQYLPSYDDPASFMSVPILDNGAAIGALIIQVPIDQINAIMTYGGKWNASGLGKTGESWLVGSDRRPRSISRFMVEDPDNFIALQRSRGRAEIELTNMAARKSNVGLMQVKTEAVARTQAGKTGLLSFTDYRGIEARAAYAPFDVVGLRWGIITKMDEEEINTPITLLTRQILIAATVALVLLGLIALFAGLRLARSINVPLSQVQDTVAKVSAGDLDARTGMQSSDEIGQLGRAFDGMLNDKVAELARAQKENDQLNNSVIEIMTSVAQLAQRDLNVKVPVSEDVTGAVSDAINMMTGSTARALREVNTISAQVSDSSGRVKQRSDNVYKLADEASNQANAASAELSTTASALRQIGEQAQGAGREAERALVTTNEAMAVVRATVEGITNSRDQIRETEKRVKRLAERSQEISSAVNIIGQIAERTSVLALNASMQAVAAGEAGRGFAVVADEVKRLAENAREATQQIAGLVSAIQSDTTETLQAMNGTITQVVEITRLADRAGTQMNENREATEALVNSVRSISVATQAQGEASQRLLARAYDLISASQNTLEEIEQQRGDTQTLTDSASALVRTVSEFRLPG